MPNPAALALLLLLGALALPAAAQDEVVFSTLGVDLWPDYDRPGVLVIYRATIAPGVALPRAVTLRIPAAVGDPSAVAERQADGQLINVPYERSVDGEVAVLQMTVTRPSLQVEYYDPSLVHEDALHSFVFTWPADYEVGDLTVSVQQPDLAQNLVTDPPAASRAPGVDGLTYHDIGLGAVPAGQPVDVQVSYEKASDQLSFETMTPVAPSAAPTTPPTAASPASSDSEVTLIVMVILAVAAIATVAVAVLRTRGAKAPVGSSQGGAPRAPGAEGARFCTQCGDGAAPGDRFCGNCGSTLR